MRTSLLYAAAAVAVLTSGCSRSWMRDESSRIDEVMAHQEFDPDSRAARGICIFQAEPLAPPWREGEGYQIRRDAGSQGRRRALTHRTTESRRAAVTGAAAPTRREGRARAEPGGQRVRKSRPGKRAKTKDREVQLGAGALYGRAGG